MAKRILAGVLTCALLLLASCVDTSQPTTARDTIDESATVGPFHEPLREIARTYESYGRLDPRKMLWAPAMCRAPQPRADNPAVSASGDADTHGRKLYSLYVSHFPDDAERPGSYAAKTASPVGTVVVKESWLPREVKAEQVQHDPVARKLQGTRTTLDGKTEPYAVEDRFVPFAEKGGKWYHAAERGPLFVMMKFDPRTPGTDQGWVYGVVSPDGQEVQAVGRLASCMNCHDKAPHDRLFGPPKD